MKSIYYIHSANDQFGQRWTVWYHGDYQYEIECRTTKKKIRLNDTSYEEAMGKFASIVERVEKTAIVSY